LTRVLARYYIQDKSDSEAQKQYQLAKAVLESGQPLMVCLTVILEFEWILRGYYHFNATEISSVFKHLLSSSHITIEKRSTVQKALAHVENGFYFADALHHASYKECDQVVSFDDKKFSRRSKRFGLMPSVVVPRNNAV